MAGKQTARVILTFDCPRKCDYCCNEYKHIISGAKPVSNPSDVKGYAEVCLTGGEPLLATPTGTIGWASWLKRKGVPKVYVYMSAYRDLKDVRELLCWVDGIHYTLHKKSTLDDCRSFAIFQDLIASYPKKTYRLFIHPEFPYSVVIRPEIWTRIELKPWDGPNTCELPANEDLFYWREMCTRPA